MAKTAKKERTVRSNEELIKAYEEKIKRAQSTVDKYKAKIDRIQKIANKSKYNEAAKKVKALSSEQLAAFNAWLASQNA